MVTTVYVKGGQVKVDNFFKFHFFHFLIVDLLVTLLSDSHR